MVLPHWLDVPWPSRLWQWPRRWWWPWASAWCPACTRPPEPPAWPLSTLSETSDRPNPTGPMPVHDQGEDKTMRRLAPHLPKMAACHHRPAPRPHPGAELGGQCRLVIVVGSSGTRSFPGRFGLGGGHHRVLHGGPSQIRAGRPRSAGRQRPPSPRWSASPPPRSPWATASPSRGPRPKTKVVTAKTVTVSQPTSGKCTGGFGGFPGGASGGVGAGGPPSGSWSFPAGKSGGIRPTGRFFPRRRVRSATFGVGQQQFQRKGDRRHLELHDGLGLLVGQPLTGRRKSSQGQGQESFHQDHHGRRWRSPPRRPTARARAAASSDPSRSATA